MTFIGKPNLTDTTDSPPAFTAVSQRLDRASLLDASAATIATPLVAIRASTEKSQTQIHRFAPEFEPYPR